MNKVNNLQEDFPDKNHEFQIDILGRITKRRYVGDFVCKIPTIKDQAMIAKHEAHLNGEFPVYLDGGIQKIHKMIAYLRFTLTDYPKFWRDSDLGYELHDDNVIKAIYDEVIAFENEWLQKVWGIAEESESESAEETKKG